MSRTTVLIVEGLAVRAAFEEVRVEAVLRPSDSRATTLLRMQPHLRDCDLVTLASTAPDGIQTAERLSLDLAKELRRTTWWAPEPVGDVLDLSEIMASKVACAPPPPLTTCFADIESVPLRWLIPGFLPQGKLAVLAGQPGLGKSMLTVELAARLSKAEGMPGEPPPDEPAGTVFLSAEDDPADTIRPRLEAAGADLSRIRFTNVPTLEVLERLLDECPGVRLVVVDPLGAYLDRTDSHNDAQVRGFLAPLADICRVRGITLLLVAHLNKNEAMAAIYRVGGSVAFVAAARIGWAVAKDRNDPRRILLVNLKNNVGSDRGGWAFRVEAAEAENSARIRFEEGRVTTCAEDALRGEPAKASAMDQAKHWLSEFLADGPRLQTEIEEHAKAEGIAVATLRRARSGLGVRSRKDGDGGKWRWHLPPPGGQGAQDDQEAHEGG